MDPCAFDTLFSKSVPHILEKIFFSLDYASFKNCFEVCSEWNGLLTTKQYQRRGKLVFHDELKKDEQKLWYASVCGESGKVRTLLSSGMLCVDSVFRGSTPLYMASWINMANEWGVTPLKSAANKGHKDVVQLLLDRGADPNMANQAGSTALSFALQNGHMDVSNILTKNGGNA